MVHTIFQINMIWLVFSPGVVTISLVFFLEFLEST